MLSRASLVHGIVKSAVRLFLVKGIPYTSRGSRFPASAGYTLICALRFSRFSSSFAAHPALIRVRPDLSRQAQLAGQTPRRPK